MTHEAYPLLAGRFEPNLTKQDKGYLILVKIRITRVIREISDLQGLFAELAGV